jgi:hypothetical protein
MFSYCTFVSFHRPGPLCCRYWLYHILFYTGAMFSYIYVYASYNMLRPICTDLPLYSQRHVQLLGTLYVTYCKYCMSRPSSLSAILSRYVYVACNLSFSTVPSIICHIVQCEQRPSSFLSSTCSYSITGHCISHGLPPSPPSYQCTYCTTLKDNEFPMHTICITA